MERPSMVSFLELSVSYLALFLFFLVTTNEAAEHEHSVPDLVYLMAIKKNLTDPFQNLHNWNSNNSPCSFNGVKCDSNKTFVMELDLGNFSLGGSFPTAVCGLQNITFLSLGYNSIVGELPKDLTSCSKLRHLNLSQNLLQGALPDFISELSSLEVLDLSGNNFSGPVPSAYARLGKLQTLDLYYNLLGGTIPGFLGNLTNLVNLRLTYNPFDSGFIPLEIGNMTKLQQIWLSECNLIGEIPDSVGRLSELQQLDVSQNNLTGPWPRWTSNLVKLESLQMHTNRFRGEIPADIGQMTSLKLLDVSGNMLTGSLPDSLGNLGKLTSLHLMDNLFTGEIPASLANLTKLRDLSLFKNSLLGEIPQNLGRNTQLEIFDLSNNRLRGPLPSQLCNGGKLSVLNVFNNMINGNISEYENCTTLVRLRLANNQLSGEVPKSLWGFPGLELLELSTNRFEGNVAREIRSAKSLSKLAIDGNEFSGELPIEIGMLSTLSFLNASNNNFSGRLPNIFDGLQQLERLDLAQNSLSGAIFPSIGSVGTLALINLKGNYFSGEIPNQIGNLQSLTYLDLSENHLTKKVPASLANLHLIVFNVSSNNLSGLVPSGLIRYKRAFLGNPRLCGDGFADINPCASKRGYLKIVVLCVCFSTAAIVLVVGLWCFYKSCSNIHPTVMNKSTIDFCPSKVVSFRRLVFHEHEIVNSLSEANVIGTGGAGKVYKINLDNGETVAVKRLPGSTRTVNSEYDGGFKAEIETLGIIRHKNIVKLWGGISLQDSNLLIYEYMPNGSIGNMLHEQKPCSLDWPTRYMIALDSAQGLAYLHYDCNPPIIHCDIKSNNILLDEELRARVADFGLAKILRKCNKGYETVFAVAGSYGYFAPEVSYSPRVTAKNDVYSFGVVLLELVTSKRPVDPSYGEGANIVKWVNRMLDKENGLEEILDHQISEIYKDSVQAVLRIALDCTNSLPFNRPNMRHVVWMLQSANPNGKSSISTSEQEGNETDTIHL